MERHHLRLERHRAQVKALKESMQRHKELEQDEAWKKRHCRLCPQCRRPIEKTQGCHSMVCGQNFHGGNEQPGCGRKFDWATALPYDVSAGAFDSSLPNEPAVLGRLD